MNLAESADGVISTQVMQEFFAAATRKLGVSPLVAKGVLKTFSIFETVQVSTALIHEAVRRVYKARPALRVSTQGAAVSGGIG